jgi:hypothetical protein
MLAMRRVLISLRSCMDGTVGQGIGAIVWWEGALRGAGEE